MPNALQGLNVVYPPQPPPTESSGQELLSTPPGFPDLTAQLDLWTNLSFASDEPFIDSNRPDDDIGSMHLRDAPLIAHTESPQMNHDLIASRDKTMQAYGDIESNHHPVLISNGAPGSFDLGSFLAGFGIDPFLVPPQSSTDEDNFSSLPPHSTTSPTSSRDDSSTSTSNSSIDAQPPSKRTRTRRTSIISPAAAVTSNAAPQPVTSVSRAVSEFSDDHDPLSTPLTASEDKRRRNTAASARFRAKKKEREQAMERRSKDLESRVNELERECEGLRRENGWLKGLVVGVTSGNASSVPASSTEESIAQEISKKRKRESNGATEN